MASSYTPAYGIVFGNPSVRDETPTPKRHQQFEPSSYGLLVAQEEAQKLRAEIKTQFLKDEERAFLRSMTAAYKKTARREARLDLEEENRKELVRMEMKLRAKMLENGGGVVEKLKEEVKGKEEKIRVLKQLGAEMEEEIEEKEAKIRELEGVVAGMMEQVRGLKKAVIKGERTDEET